MKQIKTSFFMFVSLIFIHFIDLSTQCKEPKIVGLAQVRNESNIIENFLRALALYADEIVIVDDASIDGTPDLISAVSQTLSVPVHLMKRTISSREDGNESDNSQILLERGRAVGGTHFIMIDADELFTANCAKDNFLRNQILTLTPGERIEMCWINFWRSINEYRFDQSQWTWMYGPIIFCDDGKCSYHTYLLHNGRVPQTLKGKTKRINAYEYGIMHFQFVNWRNLMIKQAWYRCLERVRQPNKPAQAINMRYAPSKDERNLKTMPSHFEWFSGYSFFDSSAYNKPVPWREEQIYSWMEQYGKNYFASLDIWDIDWQPIT